MEKMLPLAIISFALSANAVAADISDISYEDLKQLNVSCQPNDICAGRKPDYYPGLSFPQTCSCHPECPLLDTCCIDSPHRGGSPANQKCGAVDFPQRFFSSSGYYMFQSCPENSVWRHLCEGDLDKDGDVLRIAPVSSLDTNATYKNYYCFRCNERTDNFLYWDLVVMSDSNGPRPDDFKVAYNDVDKTWTATSVDGDISIPVRLQFGTPRGVRFPAVPCDPKVVTGCPDSWEDAAVRSKCDSYMALLYKTFGPVYRNAHCALCNSQPLDELSCVPPQYAYVQKVAFSFAHLIDVNTSDGDEVGKKAKCAGGQMWDPYGKKCRKLSCALPGFVIRDGQCVAP